jgi:hypothetical protein
MRTRNVPQFGRSIGRVLSSTTASNCRTAPEGRSEESWDTAGSRQDSRRTPHDREHDGDTEHPISALRNHHGITKCASRTAPHVGRIIAGCASTVALSNSNEPLRFAPTRRRSVRVVIARHTRGHVSQINELREKFGRSVIRIGSKIVWNRAKSGDILRNVQVKLGASTGPSLRGACSLKTNRTPKCPVYSAARAYGRHQETSRSA